MSMIHGSVTWYQRLFHFGFLSPGQSPGSISRDITSAD